MKTDWDPASTPDIRPWNPQENCAIFRLPKRFPLAPDRFPFYYGWVIVVASTLGIVSSIPGQTMGVSVFTPRLEAALGISSTNLSLAYAAGTITSGLLLVRGGRLIDRLGVRLMMMVCAMGLGTSLLLFAVCDYITGSIEAVLGAGAHTAIALAYAALGFFLIRFLGQGLMAMIPRIMVGKWFHRRRGLAIGLSGVITAFGFGYAPVFLHDLIEAFGWRGAYAFLAALTGVGMTLVAWVFYREQPEDFGLVKDGHEIDEPEHAQRESRTGKRDFTLEEARRNYEFWLYTFCLGAQGMIVTAVTFHILSIGSVAGLTDDNTVKIFLPMSIISVASNLTGGWVSDRTKLKYLIMVQMLALGIATVSLSQFSEPTGRLVVIVGFGISGGLFGCIIGVAWPRFFGIQHLGAISGQNMSIMVLMTSAGPLLFATSFNQFDSYTPALMICAVLPAILLIGALRSGNPQDRAIE